MAYRRIGLGEEEIRAAVCEFSQGGFLVEDLVEHLLRLQRQRIAEALKNEAPADNAAAFHLLVRFARRLER